MKTIVATTSIEAGSLRLLATVAVCILLAATLLACSGGGEDSAGDEDAAGDERVIELEAKAHSLEESPESLAAENAELRAEIALTPEQQADLREAQEEGQVRVDERPEGLSLPKGSALERTVRLVEESGGEVSYLEHPGRADHAVLVMPLEFVDGETPLIVSLHGFRGDAASFTAHVPLHERVNSEGFALLLPNGVVGGAGNRFWNPTDRCCDSGNGGENDVAYLTELVASAREVGDFGPVYFFGYSNGGFMAYHMACKGLPGLRAVASLAGTSYLEDSSCEGAPPVSVLHIHGTADSVIRFEGAEAEPDSKTDGRPAFYAGAQEMVMRWSQRAGCEWPHEPQPYATLDLDRHAAGPETRAFRLESGCAEGISIEFWMGVGSSHAPGYGDVFVDALVAWLLSQE